METANREWNAALVIIMREFKRIQEKEKEKEKEILKTHLDITLGTFGTLEFTIDMYVDFDGVENSFLLFIYKIK